MIEEKIQIILPIILRNVGPLLLRGGIGGLSGGGGTTTNNDDDDFSDDDDDSSVKTGDDGRKVSISLPTFPPDTDDDDDEDDSTTSDANNNNNNGSSSSNDANVGGYDGSAVSSTSSSSSTAENSVDSNSESNIINASSIPPNVSSPDVQIEAIEMIEIHTSDQSTVNLPDSTVNQQPSTTTTTTTTIATAPNTPSSQPSVDTIPTATDNPITLTGFNNENGIPTNLDPNTNIIFKHTEDDNTSTNAQPSNADDTTYLIDIRSGFIDEPNFTATTADTNASHTQNDADILKNLARRSHNTK